jgi:FkbM family methyltransferase
MTFKENSIKAIFKKCIRCIGYNIHKYSPDSDPYCQLNEALKVHKIDLVFDIGANNGQFAIRLRKGNYNGQIISFEPLVDAHHILSHNANENKGWTVHERCAIGDRNGTIRINVSQNSACSSVLPILQESRNAAPESAYIKTEEAPIHTLDSVSDQYMAFRNSTLIKIDTQGFEWQVLDGATKTLEGAKGVMVELTIVPLYSGQRLWKDIIARLEELGFILWSLNPSFVDPRNGKTLQVDGVFFRK